MGERQRGGDGEGLGGEGGCKINKYIISKRMNE